jgi:hypothetical protein
MTRQEQEIWLAAKGAMLVLAGIAIGIAMLVKFVYWLLT